MRICVVGDTGMLGQAFIRTLSNKNRLFGVSAPSPVSTVASPGCKHVDIDLLTKAKDFFNVMDSFKPELIINAVACVDMLKCEREPEYAMRINAALPGELAQYAARKAIGFVHISSDAIFDGLKSKPYQEDDPAQPQNQYGWSKLKGEQQTLAQNPEALICRTNIVGFRGWKGAPTFAEWLCDILYHQKPATLADDFVTSSMCAEKLGPLVIQILQKKGKGIFHVASRDAVSKYQFGTALARELGVGTANIRRGSLKDLGLEPPRAAFIALDVSRTEKFLGQKLPDIKSTVQKLAQDFNRQLKESLHA